MSTSNKPLSKAIVLAGFATGTLDILSAFASAWIRNSTTPAAVLKFVASGVFGVEAHSGGAMIAVFGLLFHYLIAFSWSVLFFLLYSKVSILRAGVVLPAVIYGLCVWLVMNQVVLPLSNTPKFPFNLTSAIIGSCILIVAIGLPNVLLARKHFGS
ncbi:DUF1440 domain-containing protein [Imperialibacter roseus]|uniref:DUF1440 domain-containing protein n=1 Tax=Imperialibacter roseus TaxID=1324217 RepID=A0ABZ0IR64_9BACT|nr:DUF1440 domain-containing protein [Imperialibacter roseus]WOK07489.1 DUF1440 domain-containing protein [Imperialibacter roseus]